MNRYSRRVSLVMVFLLVSSPVCFAGNGTILSGQDLLRAVREKDGGSAKPAYSNRPAKTTKAIPTNVQSQTAAKSANNKLLKITPTDSSKDSRFTKTGTALVSDIKGKGADRTSQVDIPVDRPSTVTANLSDLTSETSFGEAIRILRNSVDPPLNIVVLWRDLEENADIDRTTPINMDGISGVRLGTVLELLLASVSGGFSELGYVVEDGVIVIATKESLPKKSEVRVYDVTDLLGRPANFYEDIELFNMMGMMGGYQGYDPYGRYGGHDGYRGFSPVRRGYYGSGYQRDGYYIAR